MVISADIGRATFGGAEARNVSARLKVDGSGLQIDRLSVADLGGGSLSANGRIDTGGHAPRGSLVLDFETKQAAAIAALAAKFGVASANPAAAALDRVGHAKLHATLDIADDKENPAATVARLNIAGDLDAMRIDASARADGDWTNPSAADVQVDATIDAADGATLLKLVGLDRIVAAGKGPGRFKLQIAGHADAELRGSLALSAGGLSVNSRIAVAGLKASQSTISTPKSAVRLFAVVSTSTSASPARIDGALDVDTLDAASIDRRRHRHAGPRKRRRLGLE